MLYRGLKTSGIYKLSAKTLIFIGKLVVSSSVMALVVYQLSADFDVWLAMGLIEQVIQLTICITLGIVSYLSMIILLGIRLADFKVIKE